MIERRSALRERGDVRDAEGAGNGAPLRGEDEVGPILTDVLRRNGLAAGEGVSARACGVERKVLNASRELLDAQELEKREHVLRVRNRAEDLQVGSVSSAPTRGIPSALKARTLASSPIDSTPASASNSESKSSDFATMNPDGLASVGSVVMSLRALSRVAYEMRSICRLTDSPRILHSLLGVE